MADIASRPISCSDIPSRTDSVVDISNLERTAVPAFEIHMRDDSL